MKKLDLNSDMAAFKTHEKALLTLKVTLLGTAPPIWRRFEVMDFITLEDLHYVLQLVMGWEDAHLHQYFSGKVRYGIPSRDDPYNSVRDEGTVLLSDVFKRKGSKLRYEYGFGDGWLHEIVVESISPSTPAHKHPICLAGMRQCPPEDVGGVWGYAELLESVSNPRHPRRREFEEWLDGPYNPDHFEVEEINRILSEMKYTS